MTWKVRGRSSSQHTRTSEYPDGQGQNHFHHWPPWGWGVKGVRAAVGATGESIGGTGVVLVDAASAASASSACARVESVAAHRLVGNGREDEQGGSHHQCEHADVKEQGAGDVHLAHQRPVEVGGVAGQERDSQTTRSPAPWPVRTSMPVPIQRRGSERQMGLHPGRA